MASVEDLKRIFLFENLTERMLEQLAPEVQEQSFKETEIIYEAGNPASRFYSLRRGKVLLQIELANAIIISLGAIKPGYSFGWSALSPGVVHTSYAVCAEPCEILSMPGDKFTAVLEKDHTMGFMVMRRAARIL